MLETRVARVIRLDLHVQEGAAAVPAGAAAVPVPPTPEMTVPPVL
jgi:hypothetical protein